MSVADPWVQIPLSAFYFLFQYGDLHLPQQIGSSVPRGNHTLPHLLHLQALRLTITTFYTISCYYNKLINIPQVTTISN